MKFGVVQFPGSNCDQDAYFAVKDILGKPVEYLWHGEADIRGADVVILPGGFSYGDYLRCGAIARFSPVMEAVQKHAARGGFVLGICNGFQVLCEAQLLPGALMRNDNRKFVCKYVDLTVENSSTALTCCLSKGQTLSIPVAHGEGKYVCNAETAQTLATENRILFRYAGEAMNPNGSMDNIAGIVNKRGNIFGMMPHPERASSVALGSADGMLLFKSLLTAAAVAA